jgi:hypothetical protein
MFSEDLFRLPCWEKKTTEHAAISLLIMDCKNVYHNADVYNVLTEAEIEMFPSAGHTQQVKGGYQHDCMPCELINRVQRNGSKETQQTPEVTLKHEQSVLRNSQNR